MGTESIWLWVGFNVFVLGMLALDLGVFHRKSHVVSVKEATAWSAVWISLALTFNAGIYFYWNTLIPGSSYSNSEAALAFLTGYLIEKSLSVDNIFVIALIFGYFAVPAAYQHRVLFWGILGALVMRAAMIFAGAALLKEYHFLIFTGIKMFTHKEEELHPESNPVIKLVRKLIPVTKNYEDDHFFVRHAGKLMATPLFLVLIMVETTDLVFAVDSIPAIFAVTQDPFIVYTSNVFAILGLRSLYFVLAGVIDKFYYLKMGLAVILTFVGVKMTMIDLYKIPTPVSLGVIATVLTIAVVASLIRARSLEAAEQKRALTEAVQR
jgi:tellurite resistance protein TerC